MVLPRLPPPSRLRWPWCLQAEMSCCQVVTVHGQRPSKLIRWQARYRTFSRDGSRLVTSLAIKTRRGSMLEVTIFFQDLLSGSDCIPELWQPSSILNLQRPRPPEWTWSHQLGGFLDWDQSSGVRRRDNSYWYASELYSSDHNTLTFPNETGGSASTVLDRCCFLGWHHPQQPSKSFYDFCPNKKTWIQQNYSRL